VIICGRTCRPRSEYGIGLLGAVALLTVMTGMVVLTVPMVHQVRVARNTARTVEDMAALKRAIAGNSSLTVGNSRVDFGFVGGMGQPPETLNQLWLQDGLALFSVTTSLQTGVGWAGPYLPRVPLEDLVEFDKDAFGNAYQYSTTPFVRASDGATVVARLTSRGADQILSTADDIIVDILADEVYGRVEGVAYENGVELEGAVVTLNLPVDGVLDTRTDVTDGVGVFEFDNVPFGYRSVGIFDPGVLSYVAGSANTYSGGDRVRFQVINTTGTTVDITQMVVTWEGAAGYYQQIFWDGSEVWDRNDDTGGVRAASGQTVILQSTQSLFGNAKPNRIVPLRVGRSVTATELRVYAGSGIEIEVRDFRNNQSGGGGGAVDVTGLEFTVEFLDGATPVFAGAFTPVAS
jgi:hypothetical protein